MKGRSDSKGRFIVLDGPDGCGKSTQLALLQESLAVRKIPVRLVRDPGSTYGGEKIRELLLDKKKARLSALTETFLFQAARAQLVEEAIRPALEQGFWVLCDRFFLSTLVYQGIAGEVDPKAIQTMSLWATGGLFPDLYLILWASFKTCLERRKGRKADRMEGKGHRFGRKVSEGYKRLAHEIYDGLKHPAKVVWLDTSEGIGAVHQKILKEVETLGS